MAEFGKGQLAQIDFVAKISRSVEVFWLKIAHLVLLPVAK